MDRAVEGFEEEIRRRWLAALHVKHGSRQCWVVLAAWLG